MTGPDKISHGVAYPQKKKLDIYESLERKVSRRFLGRSIIRLEVFDLSLCVYFFTIYLFIIVREIKYGTIRGLVHVMEGQLHSKGPQPLLQLICMRPIQRVMVLMDKVHDTIDIVKGRIRSINCRGESRCCRSACIVEILWVWHAPKLLQNGYINQKINQCVEWQLLKIFIWEMTSRGMTCYSTYTKVHIVLTHQT